MKEPDPEPSANQPSTEPRHRREPLDPATLLQRWRHLPQVDPDALRHDIDRIIDQSL